MSEPEVWLRGPLPDYPALLQPVAHALLQAREDLHRLAASVREPDVWTTPGGAASVGFHVLHIAGSVDRLTAYARGEALTERQRQALREEESVGAAPPPFADVVALAVTAIDSALEQVKSTAPESLLDARRVGRAGLPSTVIGLLVHVAEHTTRHVGQAMTTARILAGQ